MANRPRADGRTNPSALWINAWPTHILIGKDGTILANRVGAGDMSALIASAI